VIPNGSIRGEVLIMETASRLRAPFLAACGLISLSVTVGCSFDASQLRPLASPAPDGAIEHPAVSDTGGSGSGGNSASPPDAPIATGGSGGSARTGGAGGMGATSGAGGIVGVGGISSGGSGGGGSSGLGSTGGRGDAGVPDAPGAQPDVPIGGEGGGAGGSGDIGGGGGTGGVDALRGSGANGGSTATGGGTGGASDTDAGVAGSGGGGGGAPACIPPAVPTGVTATASNDSGNITVSWGTVTGATGYTVSRGTSANGTFTAVITNQTATAYTDSGLAAGTTSYYVVSASNAGGTCTSGNSTPAVSAMSCVPIGPTLTAKGGIGQVVLTWTASTGATSYDVWRGTASGGPYTSIATTTATTYTDTGCSNGTTYYYIVTALNGLSNACVAAQSSQVSATPRACPIATGQTFEPNPNTTGTFCFITCDDIGGSDVLLEGWGCSNMDGRTITVNGTAVTCPPNGGSGGSTLPAKVNGAYTFNLSAGTYGYAQVNWYGVAVTCPP